MDLTDEQRMVELLADAVRFVRAGGFVTLREWDEIAPERQMAIVKARSLMAHEAALRRAKDEAATKDEAMERAGRAAIAEQAGRVT